MLTSKQRLIKAIKNEVPDRLPVTTHHVMPYYLNTYMDGCSSREFFDHFDFDAITWAFPLKPNENRGEYFDIPSEKNSSSTPLIFSDKWRIEQEPISDPQYNTNRYNIVTPKGTLTTVLQSNEYTSWVTEHLIKEKKDIDLIGEFVTTPLCDVESVNQVVEDFGERGIVRGHICCFDIFGQPGCWQDAACLVGIEKLIMATFDDPQWVHDLLGILKERKKVFVDSLAGANFDLLEFGGGDASSTVISPKMFDDFVAPYDAELIEAAHKAGQRIVYHTCGGMMPILENIAAMEPDVMETFTPEGMGGDASLKEAKKRIGDKVCMIGGFDQFHFFKDCSPEDTKKEVRRCFEEAGENGGFILCPSDHFFDAESELLKAFADEAKSCLY